MAAARTDLHHAAVARKMLPQRWLLKAFIVSGDLEVLYLLFVQVFTQSIIISFVKKLMNIQQILGFLLSVKKNFIHSFPSMTFSLSCEVPSSGTTRTLYPCGKKSTKHSYRILRALGLIVFCIAIIVRFMCAREISETQEYQTL